MCSLMQLRDAQYGKKKKKKKKITINFTVLRLQYDSQLAGKPELIMSCSIDPYIHVAYKK